MGAYENYEMTIGIECHVQLKTKTKLFSRSDNDARESDPNTKISMVDFAIPGTLPVLNYQAVALAVKAAKALSAKVNLISSFDRKHYFYPDLPKGYQTTQMYNPIIGEGKVDAPLEDGSSVLVRIHHAHLEEDAGKLTHESSGSLVDLNRAGTPLLEIVSEPDIHSAKEARAYAEELHYLMVYSGVTEGDLYYGNMRFDVNISIAEKGAEKLGVRTEVKNLNSFRSIEKAVEYEFKRQVDVVEAGGQIIQETRGWDDDAMITSSQRSKEDALDYRYMPDADISPVELTYSQVDEIQSEVPRLPGEYREAFSGLKVDSSVIRSVLSDQRFAMMVFDILTLNTNAAKRVANWLASNLDSHAEVSIPSVDDLLQLSEMTDKSDVSSNGASELFNCLMRGEKDVRKLAEDKNLLQVSDEGMIQDIINEVLADPASQKSIEDIKNGKDKAIGYLVGQVMKRSQGKMNPALAQDMIRKGLGL